MLSSLNIAPAKTAGNIASTKGGGLNALVALYSKVVLVALSSSARAQALLCPVTWFVRSVFVFADQDFSLREVQLDSES